MNFNKIITFGLTEEQNKTVYDAFPAKGYELISTDAYTDTIAIQCTVVIINSDVLKKDEYDALTSYYSEVAAGLYETIFWIGRQPTKNLINVLKCYDTFEQFNVNIKYHFLEAHRRCKKSKDYSEKLSDSFRILSEIRKKPGIKTKELSEIIERPSRTVLRYIGALVATGEWIAYDNTTKGWYLEYGKSVLFGDVFSKSMNDGEM